MASDETGHDAQGKAVTLPVAPAEILKTVFATDQGDTSRVTDTDDGSIFAVHVDKITAPQVKPLAEVKDQAVAAGRPSRSARAQPNRPRRLPPRSRPA